MKLLNAALLLVLAMLFNVVVYAAPIPAAVDPSSDSSPSSTKQAELYSKLQTWQRINTQLETWTNSFITLQRYSQEVFYFYLTSYQASLNATSSTPSDSTLSTPPTLNKKQLNLEFEPLSLLFCDQADTECVKMFTAIDKTSVAIPEDKPITTPAVATDDDNANLGTGSASARAGTSMVIITMASVASGALIFW